MVHTPEQWLGKVLLRADFRAFYAAELVQDRPLGAILGECLSQGITPLYRLGWHLTETHRRRHPLEWDEYLEALPSDAGGLILGLVNEAITPVCPVHDVPAQTEPKRVPWTRLLFEAQHILGWSKGQWWRATFRTQQALLWEYARLQDPEGKHGRAMSEEEITAVNRRNMAMLMGLAGADGPHGKLEI